VCAVALGSGDPALESELEREFPAAARRRDDGAVRAWAEEIVRRVEGEPPRLAVPLDLQGTDFQRRVWQALRAIPLGETRSYAEVAAAVGAPRAARAVGLACAGNKAAVVVPCHRVLPAAGGLGGYRWGPERKRRLLERERRARAPEPDGR
jgi:AraC family transcriptional regulator of adaptative response/methylated-DNA-[protein]-cysteine methyltransferase